MPVGRGAGLVYFDSSPEQGRNTMADNPANLTNLADRRILIALTGGIACYKIGEVVSRLVQSGASVTVLMTEAATRFVSPLTFQALSGRPVYTSPWQHIEAHDPQHISLARSADLMLIAPAPWTRWRGLHWGGRMKSFPWSALGSIEARFRSSLRLQ